MNFLDRPGDYVFSFSIECLQSQYSWYNASIFPALKQNNPLTAWKNVEWSRCIGLKRVYPLTELHLWSDRILSCVCQSWRRWRNKWQCPKNSSSKAPPIISTKYIGKFSLISRSFLVGIVFLHQIETGPKVCQFGNSWVFMQGFFYCWLEWFGFTDGRCNGVICRSLNGIARGWGFRLLEHGES